MSNCIIADEAFRDCYKLSGQLIIPDTVKTIGNYAFYNCTELISLIIGSEIKEIGDFAFANCSALETHDLGIILKLLVVMLLIAVLLLVILPFQNLLTILVIMLLQIAPHFQ